MIDAFTKVLKFIGRHPIWMIFMTFVMCVDVVQLILSPILDFIGLGEIMDWLIDLGMSTLYTGVSFLNRKKLLKGKIIIKLLLVGIGIMIGKAIPFISAFPLWSLDFGFIILMIAAETEKENLEKLAKSGVVKNLAQRIVAEQETTN